LIIAIALLHAFIQLNFTGPNLPFTPSDLLPQTTSLADLNAAVLPLLTLQGEPAYHLACDPILLLLAIRVFDSLPALTTLPWWKLRLHLVHQSLLDEPVALSPQVLDALQDLPVDGDLQATLYLELGLLYHSLGQEKQANQAFLAAAKASGLEFELTGAMGRRTKFQVEAHSQLVLLAESRARPDDNDLAPVGDSAVANDVSHVPETIALNDDTLLEETEFTKSTTSTDRLSHLDPSSQPPLHPLDQALLLGLCLSQHNHSPSSGLTASQMMPFVSRVVSHPRNWSIHTTALLLRSRLESSRSRTVERSALQLAALIDQMPTSDSTTRERLR
jgi:hypothetical protein